MTISELAKEHATSYAGRNKCHDIPRLLLLHAFRRILRFIFCQPFHIDTLYGQSTIAFAGDVLLRQQHRRYYWRRVRRFLWWFYTGPPRECLCDSFTCRRYAAFILFRITLPRAIPHFAQHHASASIITSMPSVEELFLKEREYILLLWYLVLSFISIAFWYISHFTMHAK